MEAVSNKTDGLTTEETEQLTDLIFKRVLKKLEENKKPTSFKEFRARYLPNKSYSWIKFYLFDQYSDQIFITQNSDGWLTPPRGRGTRVRVIDAEKGARWIRKALTTGKLDLNAPEPVTLARRAGLAKPIKRRNSSK